MNLKSPQYRILPQNASYLKGNLWEVSVPRHQKTGWSIVLSCLLTSELKEKLSKYIGLDDNVDNAIQNFNPFKDQLSFTKYDAFRKVVQKFIKIYQTSGAKDDDEILLYISDLMDCTLLRLTENMEIYDVYENGSYTTGNIQYLPSRSIILFVEKGKLKNSFGLQEKYCLEWKYDALKYGLLKANIPENKCEEIWQIVKDEKSFLIPILKSSFNYIIYEADLPSIMSKIKNAGYEADPKFQDSDGLSAFYHALTIGDDNLCIGLYNLAILCCSDASELPNKSNHRVISQLKILETTLNNDFERLQNCKKFNDTENGKKIGKIYNILLVLITLKIEIETKLLKIGNIAKFVKYHQENPEKSEIQHQRRIMLYILETYLTTSQHFSDDNCDQFQHYLNYKSYYDVVDLETSSMFFCNIFRLKRKLKLKNAEAYATIESEFFIFLLNHVTFNKKVKISEYFTILRNISESSSYKIPFSIREYVTDKIKLFCKILKDATIDDSVIRSEVPKEEFDLILKNYPEIKEHLLLKKLTYCMENALKIKEWDMKSVLVIQNSLQKIGEYMREKPDCDLCIKWFLSLYMPENVRNVLHNVRNELSNLDSHGFCLKFKQETNISLFKEIQKDISKIYDYIQPFIRILNLRFLTYIKKMLEASLEKMNGSDTFKQAFVDNIPNMIQNIIDNPEDYFTEPTCNDFVIAFQNVLNQLEELLKNCNLKKHNITTARAIEQMLQPLDCLLKVSLDSQYFKNNSDSELFKLKRSTNEIDFEKSVTEARDFVKECQTYFIKVSPQSTDLIRNIEKFLKHLKSPIFITNDDVIEIRRYFLNSLKEDLNLKKKIMAFANDDFSLDKRQLSNFRMKYLSNSKWILILKYYQETNLNKILEALLITDPMYELKCIFEKMSVKKCDFQRLCRLVPKLPNDLKGKFENLVKGKGKKIVGNRLSHLLNRIENLEKILIDEKNETGPLITSTESPDLVFEDCILTRYMDDRSAQLAAEMLVFDCMNLWKKDINTECKWRKSSKIYAGINLRNWLAHADVMILKICEWFDPSDMPSDIVKIVTYFLRNKIGIALILQKYKRTANAYKGDKNKDVKIIYELFLDKVKADNSPIKGLYNNKKFRKYFELLPGAEQEDKENKKERNEDEKNDDKEEK